MRTTQIKIAQYVGAHYSGNIMAELQTKTEFVVPPPEYPATAKARQPAYESVGVSGCTKATIIVYYLWMRNSNPARDTRHDFRLL